MKRFEKLKQNFEFRRAYTRGNPFVSPYFVLYTVKGRQGRIRMGITVTKKLGTAVKRNRAKRVLTAAFSDCLPVLKPGTDYVLVARSRILSVKSTVISEELKKMLTRAEESKK